MARNSSCVKRVIAGSGFDCQVRGGPDDQPDAPRVQGHRGRVRPEPQDQPLATRHDLLTARHRGDRQAHVSQISCTSSVQILSKILSSSLFSKKCKF